MARIKLTSDGKNGTIQFLTTTTTTFQKYFHKKDITELLDQLADGIKGLTIKPVKLDVHKESGDPVFLGEAFALVANASDNGSGLPKDLLNNVGDVVIISCRPFEEPGLKYELKIGVIS